MTLRRPSVKDIDFPDSFKDYLHRNNLNDAILDSPNKLARTVAEFEAWRQRRRTA